MRVADAMHGITVVPITATISQAAKIMNAKDIGSVLVEHNKNVVGIMTERDVLRKATASCLDACRSTVGQIMTRDLITINPEMDVEEAAALMQEHHIRRLPVVENGRYVGMLSLRDVLRANRYSLASRLTTAATLRPLTEI